MGDTPEMREMLEDMEKRDTSGPWGVESRSRMEGMRRKSRLAMSGEAGDTSPDLTDKSDTVEQDAGRVRILTFSEYVSSNGFSTFRVSRFGFLSENDRVTGALTVGLVGGSYSSSHSAPSSKGDIGQSIPFNAEDFRYVELLSDLDDSIEVRFPSGRASLTSICLPAIISGKEGSGLCPAEL